jgi:hypothetical protein
VLAGPCASHNVACLGRGSCKKVARFGVITLRFSPIAQRVHNTATFRTPHAIFCCGLDVRGLPGKNNGRAGRYPLRHGAEESIRAGPVLSGLTKPAARQTTTATQLESLLYPTEHKR